MVEYNLFRKDSSGRCLDCGLFDGHGNACHDAAPLRMIEELRRALDSKQREIESRDVLISRLKGTVKRITGNCDAVDLKARDCMEVVKALRFACNEGAAVDLLKNMNKASEMANEVWKKYGSGKLVQGKGVFCLEHRKVMVDGVCPKCPVKPKCDHDFKMPWGMNVSMYLECEKCGERKEATEAR